MPRRLRSRVQIWIAFGLMLYTAQASAGQLSPLAPKPNWSALDGYQHTITRDTFAHLVDSVYSFDGAFWSYADINDKRVIIYSDTAKKIPLFTLNFASSEKACAPLPYHYQNKATSADLARPLKGITIALDPGHIGGDWAKLEARWFQLGDDPPVMEAKLALITCQILAEELEADGATIVWAKKKLEPVTDLRPSDLRREAIAALVSKPVSDSYTPSFLFGLRQQPRLSRTTSMARTESRVDNEAALLFYRVAEIRARGDLVNKLHPDLTICIHYNADDWGDPDKPDLVASSKLIMFVNGCYEKGELVYDDYKYDLLRKLLDRTAPREEKGCALVGRAMLDSFKYPPDIAGKFTARQVTDVPSVYARDLLANRIYHGPVIYCEGPYMNARDAYYRIIAGDYLGLRKIRGENVPSIYRQYADCVQKGVLKYFGVDAGAK